MDIVGIILTVGFMALGVALESKNRAKKAGKKSGIFDSVLFTEEKSSPLEVRFYDTEPIVETLPEEEVRTLSVEEMIVQANPEYMHEEGVRSTEDLDPDSIENFKFGNIGDIKSVESKSIEIDPEMMIIYSEILNPKFKETLV